MKTILLLFSILMAQAGWAASSGTIIMENPKPTIEWGPCLEYSPESLAKYMRAKIALQINPEIYLECVRQLGFRSDGVVVHRDKEEIEKMKRRLNDK